MPGSGKHIFFLVASMVLLWGVFAVGSARADAAVCADCHDRVTADFADSWHARAWMDKGFGCESCHGPAGEHVANPVPENIVSFEKQSRQTNAGQNGMCLACHATSSRVSLWDMGRHGRAGIGCVDCHEIHTRRPEVAEPGVCDGCHGAIRMAVNKVSHHPVNEGKIACSDCHNPHGSLIPGMLADDDVNQLCYRCHAEKRGPFVREHPPVAENCAICHDPHGSRHENLLREKAVNLCQDCHNADLHSGRAYDAGSGSARAGRAATIGFVGRSCLNCHGNIHGSTHFNNRGFTR
ncbi:MAG: DmsE family decaheme c-type cytochrome [Deltaproteobacteria bacterium]|nr:DmsE family decaheme c-type cytochrome [Candidatus Anaeroferrophillacea bacterium]